VVEVEESLRRLRAEKLEQAVYTVHQAEDGIKAQEVFERATLGRNRTSPISS
jgi:DNA-binding response OmpR family regulator